MIRLLRNTVFEPISVTWPADKVLAILFHRSAAILYLLYFIWAATTVVCTLPVLANLQGDFFQIVFSALVMCVTLLTFLGALRFPRNARLEMYSATSLATLVAVYEAYQILAFIDSRDLTEIPDLVLTGSYFVVPLTRVVFIYRTLIKQAKASV